MNDSIRTQFIDRIKLLTKHASPARESTKRFTPTTSFLKQIQCAGIPELVCHTKVYEESMMRPPRASEAPCYNQLQCECMLLASHFPSEPTMFQGFIGVALPSNTVCILCARKSITQSFFQHLTLKTQPTKPLHSFYNLIGPFEYNTDSCLWPNNCNGITDPVVMHSRNNYYYQDGVIKQYDSVNFRMVSS